MKRNSILFSLFFFLFLHSAFKNGGNCTVQYNGIYTCSVDDETDAHIRFYDDGTVIASTSIKNIVFVNKWFTKENIDLVLKGTYKIKGCNIKFKAKGDTGEQDFNGTINGNELILEVKDAKTKAKTMRTYKFIAT